MNLQAAIPVDGTFLVTPNADSGALAHLVGFGPLEEKVRTGIFINLNL